MTSTNTGGEIKRVTGQGPSPEAHTWRVKINRRGPAFRYALGALLVIAPLLLTYSVRRTGFTLNPTWPILICLLLISWYAGRGPCLMAAFLFALALNYFFSRPPLVLKINMAEINRLAILLILAWITSARSQAEDRLRRRAQQQEAVARLAERALVERDIQSLLQYAAELVARTLDVEYSMVWEPVAGGGKLKARAGVGWQEGIIGQTTIDASTETLAGYTFTSGQPMIVKNLRRDRRAGLPAFLKDHKIVSGLSVTIPHKHSPVSVLVAYSGNRHRFSKEDVSFIQACALSLAEASERLRIEAEKEQLLLREQQARTAAEEANRLKDEFLSTVSHELRTPLNSILGWVSLLRMKAISQDEVGPGLETIERSARAQALIINDILDVSRIITGKLQLDFHPVDLTGVLQSAAESMRPTAEAKGVELALCFSTADATVSGDGARLQQAVWNLLSNAIRFTHAGGRVELELSCDETFCEIKVRDNGEGINPEFLPYVFDRFRQADSSTTRRHGGLGLGLSIVRHLVELHGGTVSAESEGLGRGATFKIKLPAVIRAEAQRGVLGTGFQDHESKPGVTVNLSGVSVLVVDDDPDARSLVTTLLEGRGASVMAASSASEALGLINLQKPDVILSDIAMPDEDGYSFIRKVRSMAPDLGGDTPAAAITAFARSEDRVSAMQAGFQTYVAKPFHPSELLAVVGTLAGRNPSLPSLR